MIAQVILDPRDPSAQPLDDLIRRLRGFADHPEAEMSEGPPTEGMPSKLWVSDDPARVQAASSAGFTAWLIAPNGSGDLDRWQDLWPAMAFANGALHDLKSVVSELLRAKGLKLQSLGWTPDGSAAGSASDGTAVFTTAGPNGENPHLFTGGEAVERQRETGLFVNTLLANEAIAPSGAEMGPGQTHVLKTSEGRRPKLERQRLNYF
jgi:hypothetical protein